MISQEDIADAVDITAGAKVIITKLHVVLHRLAAYFLCFFCFLHSILI